jgi:hypothetical protein
VFGYAFPSYFLKCFINLADPSDSIGTDQFAGWFAPSFTILVEPGSIQPLFFFCIIYLFIYLSFGSTVIEPIEL